MNKWLFFLFLFSPAAMAQAVVSKPEIFWIADVLGRKGLLVIVGIIFFVYSYRNSVKLFAWIENQTYGTRDFILQKCELLFIEIKPDHVTYLLLFFAFGISAITLSIFFLFGMYTFGIILAVIFSFLGW